MLPRFHHVSQGPIASPASNGPPADTPRCEAVIIGTPETSVHEVLEPALNGAITIEDVHVETFDSNSATIAQIAPSGGLGEIPCLSF